MRSLFDELIDWYRVKKLEHWKKKTDEMSLLNGGKRFYLFRDKNGKYMIITKEQHKELCMKAGFNEHAAGDLLTKHSLYWSRRIIHEPMRIKGTI